MEDSSKQCSVQVKAVENDIEIEPLKLKLDRYGFMSTDM